MRKASICTTTSISSTLILVMAMSECPLGVRLNYKFILMATTSWPTNWINATSSIPC